MDMNELMTPDGVRDWSSEQRDTFINDATQIRQMGRIFRARLAQTEIEGDKGWAAQRRAHKVDRKFQQVARHLERAAALCEAIDATYVKEVVKLPERRAKALGRKQERQQARALTRAKAKALTAQSLSESAQHLIADPRTGQPQMPATAPAPQPQYVHPHGYTAPSGHQAPLADFSTVFEETG